MECVSGPIAMAVRAAVRSRSSSLARVAGSILLPRLGRDDRWATAVYWEDQCHIVVPILPIDDDVTGRSVGHLPTHGRLPTQNRL